MPRTSPVHYIAPSAISITPNANESAHDVAVYVAIGSKIRVFSSSIAALGFTANNTFQEWNITGRNRRLTSTSNPYTIYARLKKNDRTDGYLVFAPKAWLNGVWKDKYPYVTLDNGLAKDTAGFDTGNYWYIKLGEVSAPVEDERTLTFDTGILGTDQFNTEWNLDPDDMPLRVQLSTVIDGEDGGPTPYVPWGKTAELYASLLEGWVTSASSRIDHWTIQRIVDNEVDPDWPDASRAAAFSGTGHISLSHIRDGVDDFNSQVSVIFTVTAWGYADDDSSGSGSGSGSHEIVALASANITIMAETVEKYELVRSHSIVSYSPMADTYNPATGVEIRVRATDQKGGVSYLTVGQLQTIGLSAAYSQTGSSSWTALTFAGQTDEVAVATIPVSAFAAQKDINVRLTGADNEEKCRTLISFMFDDGEALSDFVNVTYAADQENLQNQIDGKYETWFYEGVPTLQNLPASQWTTAALKDEHVGDLYWDKTNEHAYRFKKTVNGSTTTYSWEQIGDSGVIAAMAEAAEAQDTADGKRRVFTSQPYPPYDIGDLWAQGSTGDLLKCVNARSSGSYVAADWGLATKYTDDSALTNFVNVTYAADQENLQNQIDGKYETWFYDGVPTLQNLPASGWTTAALKDEHVGDLYWDKTNEHAYRFKKTVNGSTTTYSWEQIGDSGVIAAMAEAAEAQDTADGKRRVFTSQPYPPYDVGDLWAQGSTGDLLKCVNARSSGSYVAADWGLATKYTDDSALTNFVNVTYAADQENLQNQIDGKYETWFYEGVPTLQNLPASQWTTDALKDEHVGDLYWDKTNEHAYRFKKTVNGSTTTYSWEQIGDSGVIAAMAEAAAAQDTADGKRRVFTSQPYPPYDIGDLWAQGSTGDLLKCVRAKGDDGIYEAADWGLATKYTDDTYAHGFDYLSDAMEKGDTSILGGLVLTNLIVLRNLPSQSQEVGDIMSGINGIVSRTIGLKSIAAWYGGDKVDIENLSDYWTSEQITSWNNLTPAQKAVSTAVAKSLDRFDGSGYRASGNISWDKEGNIKLKGVTSFIGDSISLNDNGVLRAVATQKWVSDTFVTKSFFNALFAALKSDDTEIPVNDANVGTLLSSIKAKVGLWTDEYLTAYGANGGTSPITLNEPLSSINDAELGTPTASGQTLVWNGTTWTYGSSGSSYSAMTASEINTGTSTTERVITAKVLNDWLNTKRPVFNPRLIDNLTLGSTFNVGDAVAVNGTIYRCKTATSKFVFTPVVQNSKMLYNELNGYRSYIFTDLTMNSDWEVWIDTGIGYELEKLRVGLAAANVRIDNINGVTMAQVQSWVNSQNYATQSWVTSRGYLTSSSLVGYATETWVNNKGYITSAALTGYATQTWVQQNFNNYSLPLAASGTRGGVQIGFTTDAANRNYAVQLSSEKMYVNVPWENTTYSNGTGLSLSNGVFAINSDYQSYISHGESAYNSLSSYLPLTGGTITGNLTVNQLFTCQNITIGNTDEINSSSGLYLQYRESGNIVMAIGGGNVGIGTSSISHKLHVAGVIYASTGVWSDGYLASYGEYSSSDITQKDVVSDGVEPDINAIANAPAIRYTWKKKPHLGLQVGSSAQYWKGVLPESVRKITGGTLTMQYGVIALLSCISIAKKVVGHDERISILEKQVAECSKENAALMQENAELRREIEILKAS